MSTTWITEVMSKTRLYVEGPLATAADLEVSGEVARYIGRVLRLRPGDAVILFDGSGAEFPAVVNRLSKASVGLSVNERIDRSVESSLEIHLLQGISRGERMDLVIQKATELGVARITPLLTEYSVVRLDPNRAEKRLHHWSGVAKSACEQCGRNVLPAIEAPATLLSWLGEHHEHRGMRVILKPGAPDTCRSLTPDDSELIVLVGPEGGFSDAEYAFAEAEGFRAIGLGPRVLRTETAALAVLAALQTLHGDLA